MIVQEAYRKFTQQRKDLVVESCHEYDSCFVFQAVPREYASVKEAGEVFDSLYAVDKNSGEITPFKPFDMPLDEYNRGKRITIYDNHKR